jgi:hypothetical protein
MATYTDWTLSNTGVLATWYVLDTSVSTAATVAWDSVTTTSGTTTMTPVYVWATRNGWEEQTRLAREMEARAAALLREHLDAEQAKQFAKDRSFTVITKDGRRRYRVREGFQRNIDQVDPSGKRLRTLCAHCIEDLPVHDQMLAQKLMLEHREEEFLKMANVS